jgi:heme exporter protein CcmD
MIYVVLAYGLAVLILGGFLWLSLGTLRQLLGKETAKK